MVNFFHTYFDDIWADLNKGIASNRNACSMPSFPHSNVWVTKDTNTLTMEFALAGYTEESISVTASNNAITVVAEPSAKEDVLSIHNGIARRNVNFTLSVDKAFDARKAKTSYVNGLLTIEMEKAEDSRPVTLM